MRVFCNLYHFKSKFITFGFSIIHNGMHKESDHCKSLGFYSKTFYRVMCFEIKMGPEQTKTPIRNQANMREAGCFLCIPPRIAVLASTFCRFPFVWLCPGALCSSVKASWCLCLTSFLLGCIAPELGKGDFWILISFLGPSRALSQGTAPSRSWRSQSALLKSRVVSLLCTLLATLELHHSMVTAAKAALKLRIPHQPLPVDEDMVQHSTSPCWFLYVLEKEVISSAFWEPPGLPVPSVLSL